MTFSKYPQHEQNPYMAEAIDNLQVARRTQMMTASGKDAIHYVVNRESGEIDGYSTFMRVIEVDEEKFAKLYLAELGALWELGKPAIRVFTYVITRLNPHQDSFTFDLDECQQFTGYKNHSSVFNGLAQLISHGIIARTTKHWQFFVNPMIVFNGSRVTFAKTIVKKQKDTEIAGPDRLALKG